MPTPADLDRRAALGLLGGVAVTAAKPAPPRPAAAVPGSRADREVRAAARGGRLYVRVNGTAVSKRAPVLFIHGGPGSSHWYFLPALALAGERPVVLYDQLDCGRSDAPGNPANWTVERFVSEVDAVRAALDLDRLHLVGHSWGAAVATEYAARRPAGLLSLTLSGALISTRSWEASARRRLAQLPRAVADTIRRHERDGSVADPDYKAAIQIYYDNFLRRRAVPPALAAYRDALPQFSNPRLYTAMWGAGETAATGSLRFYDAEPLLPRIAAPTLFLTGEFDEMVPSQVAILARRVPEAVTRIVPGAGHLGFIDNPDAWVGEIGRWTTRFG